MRLLLVRHAAAADGAPDELRALTAEGREQARALGARLRAQGVRADAIVTSPLLRARETGEALAHALAVAAVPDERLSPGATAATVTAAAAGRGETVVVVGHQPDCARVAAELSGGPEPDFPPAGLVALDVQP